MKIVYIAHPISSDVENNLADIRRIVRKINVTMPDVLPLVPYYADAASMDNYTVDEYSRGIANNTELLHRGFIDELWLTGDRVSFGMRMEPRRKNGYTCS